MGVKYRIATCDGTGADWHLDISEDSYSGAVTLLQGQRKPFGFRADPKRTKASDRRFTRMPGTVSVNLIDEAGGVLGELFGATPKQYRVDAYPVVPGVDPHGFSGFVIPGDYKHRHYKAASPSIVRATDYLGRLDSIPYQQANGSPYLGEASAVSIIHRCLEKTGLELDYAYHAQYYPKFGADELADTDNPLEFELFDQGALSIDAQSNPLSCGYVLDQVLGKHNLVCYQYGGAWRINHRRKIITLGGPADSYKALCYDSLGNKKAPFVQFIKARERVGAGTVFCFNGDPDVDGSAPLGKTSNVYQHGNPFEGLFTNLGFEDPIFTSGGDVGQWLASSGLITRSKIAHEGGQSAEFPVVYESIAGSPVSYATNSLKQTSKGIIAGATDYNLVISLRLHFPHMASLNGDLKWYFILKVGSLWLDWATSTWSTTEIINEVPVSQYLQGAGEAGFIPFQITTPDLFHAGQPIADLVTLDLRNPVETNQPGGSGGTMFFYVDDIRYDLLDPNGDPPAEALLTAAAGPDIGELDDGFQRVFGLGQGPTAGHARRVRCLDVALARHENVETWAFGADAGAPTYSLEGLSAVHDFEEFAQSNKVLRGTLFSQDGQIIGPYTNIEAPDQGGAPFREYALNAFEIWPTVREEFLRFEMEEVQASATVPTLTETPLYELEGSSGVLTTSRIGSPTIIGGGGGAGTSEVVDSISALRALSVGTTTRLVYMTGYSAAFTTGGGLWWADPLDNSTPDNTGTVVASADGKRWKRIYDRGWCPTWWGSLHNLVADDQPAWQAMVDAAPAGQLITPENGLYTFDAQLLIDAKSLRFVFDVASYWGDNEFQPGWTGVVRAGTRIFAGDNLTEAMIKVTDKQTPEGRRAACVFEYMHLVGGLSTQVNPVISSPNSDTYGLEIENGWQVTCNRCTFVSFNKSGTRVLSGTVPGLGGASQVSDLVEFDRCVSAGNAEWGIEYLGHDGWIKGGRFPYNGLGGILLGGSYTIVQGARIDLNGGIGVRVNGGLGNQVIHNIIDANEGAGIWAGPSTGGPDVGETAIVGNNCKNNGIDTLNALTDWQRSNIIVNGIRNSTLAHNYVGGARGYGVYYSGDWDVRVRGNIAETNALGASNQRVENETGEYVVTEYGVLQRGVDMGQSLMNLISVVPEGACLVFPRGNYKSSIRIDITKVIVLKGWGTRQYSGEVGAFVTAESSLNDWLFSISASGVEIMHMAFVGHPSAPSSAAGGVLWTGVTGGAMRHCLVRGFAGHNIRCDDTSNNVELHDTISRQSLRNGAFLQGSNNRVFGGEYRENAENGIYALSATEAIVRNSWVFSNGWDGIIFQGGKRCMAMGTTCRANAETGITIHSGSGHKAHDNSCYDNGTNTSIANAVDRAGILVREGTGHSVAENECSTDTGTQQYGLAVSSLVTGVRLHENFGYGNAVGFRYLDPVSAEFVETDFDSRQDLTIPALSADAAHTEVITLTGARPGDSVNATPPSTWDTTIDYKCYVDSDDTLILYVLNNSLPSSAEQGVWTFHVRRRLSMSTPPPPVVNSTSVLLLFDNGRNVAQHA